MGKDGPSRSTTDDSEPNTSDDDDDDGDDDTQYAHPLALQFIIFNYSALYIVCVNRRRVEANAVLSTSRART